MRALERILIVVLSLTLAAIVLPGSMCPMEMPNPDPDPDPDPTPSAPIVYGNGSAGDRTIVGDVNWNDAGSPINLQYQNFTIAEGATLQVNSSTVIRCTGKFINNGTLIVRLGGEGGRGASPDTAGATVTPQAGISTSSAQAGQLGTQGEQVLAGFGAVGLSEFEARKVLTAALVAGGGGAIGGVDAGIELGSDGGGSLLVLAKDGIENNGAIQADGQSGNAEGAGGGGGGGGVVILASMTSVINSGTGMITARGGDGEDGDTDEAPSGGGGGGIIHLLAPEIVNDGGTDVSAGSVGDNWVQVTAMAPRAGGGGGAAAGRGGSGVMLMSDGMPSATGMTEATDGFVFESDFDPTSLF